MIKKIITAVVMALISAILIFSGVILQKSHSEKYVQTTATLVYEETRTRLPSIFTYLYSADGRTYTVYKTGGIRLHERNISYNKAVPSINHFGHIALVTKILFFTGILFAMITLYIILKKIFNLSFAGSIPPCIFLYYVAGIAFLTESFLITALTALFTIIIIAVCLTVKKADEDSYY